ncbi:MAG: hypothetical protein MUO51_16955 [Woeseiaceae bacterium]|nr:hypothetical protein [Woeseiaceae bacterium]
MARTSGRKFADQRLCIGFVEAAKISMIALLYQLVTIDRGSCSIKTRAKKRKSHRHAQSRALITEIEFRVVQAGDCRHDA